MNTLGGVMVVLESVCGYVCDFDILNAGGVLGNTVSVERRDGKCSGDEKFRRSKWTERSTLWLDEEPDEI